MPPELAHAVATDFHGVVVSRSWHGPDVAESVEAALAFDGRPVVLADRADNAGGGASSDSTFVLAELAGVAPPTSLVSLGTLSPSTCATTPVSALGCRCGIRRQVRSDVG